MVLIDVKQFEASIFVLYFFLKRLEFLITWNLTVAELAKYFLKK